jgi:two-component system LytT family response regulator
LIEKKSIDQKIGGQNLLMAFADNIKIILVGDKKEDMVALQNILQNSGLNIHILNSFENVHSLKSTSASAADVLIFDQNESVNVINEVGESCYHDYPAILTEHQNEKADLQVELDIIDIIKKSFQCKEMGDAIQTYLKLRNHFFSQVKNLLNPVIENNPKKRNRFIVRKGIENSIIKTDEIAYFYCESGLTYLVDKKGSKFFFDDPLIKIQTQLDPDQFYRISRNYLINITSIRKFKTIDKIKIQVNLDPEPAEAVVISAAKATEFKKWISQQTE